MIKFQEKKYLLEDFTKILKALEKAEALPVRQVSSTHYYVPLNTNDVVKLVAYPDRFEIHTFGEKDGKFFSKDNLKVESTAAGLAWLKEQGHKEVEKVKMDYSEYAYQEGTVGLYTLNEDVKSVILDYPEARYAELEKLLGLAGSQPITIPYNKYLRRIGKIETITL